jgi:hypothetical protein
VRGLHLHHERCARHRRRRCDHRSVRRERVRLFRWRHHVEQRDDQLLVGYGKLERLRRGHELRRLDVRGQQQRHRLLVGQQLGDYLQQRWVGQQRVEQRRVEQRKRVERK